jgi:hypothetical protein
MYLFLRLIVTMCCGHHITDRRKVRCKEGQTSKTDLSFSTNELALVRLRRLSKFHSVSLSPLIIFTNIAVHPEEVEEVEEVPIYSLK